ncbi:MAG: tetratricopeptide repeat protein [Armatimonadetes bacterium]|nr:tetratricopeptide repeat protein [Armatimonadota bacterium]
MNVQFSPAPARDARETALWRDRVEHSLRAGSWNDCIAACHSLLRIAPRHHFAQETLATALLQLGEIEKAIAAVQRLLEISPRDPLHRLRLATLLQMQERPGQSLREFERIAEMYPDAPFSEDAREAIENLDRLQTQQILLMAAEQDGFRWQLERDPEAALEENGFYLTENGFETLRQMIPGAEDEAPPRAPRMH